MLLALVWLCELHQLCFDYWSELLCLVFFVQSRYIQWLRMVEWLILKLFLVSCFDKWAFSLKTWGRLSRGWSLALLAYLGVLKGSALAGFAIGSWIDEPSAHTSTSNVTGERTLVIWSVGIPWQHGPRSRCLTVVLRLLSDLAQSPVWIKYSLCLVGLEHFEVKIYLRKTRVLLLTNIMISFWSILR